MKFCTLALALLLNLAVISVPDKLPGAKYISVETFEGLSPEWQEYIKFTGGATVGQWSPDCNNVNNRYFYEESANGVVVSRYSCSQPFFSSKLTEKCCGRILDNLNKK
jgi:hypothetical protein